MNALLKNGLSTTPWLVLWNLKGLAITEACVKVRIEVMASLSWLIWRSVSNGYINKPIRA